MPKVSVIVPIYNVEKYLVQCLDSLINQTLKDIEIILIDDGSPDNSGKICDEYAKKDKRINVIHKKNEGVSAARNDGIKAAKGKFLMFVDSDDWCDEKMCETAYNKIMEKNVEMAFFTNYDNYEKREDYPKRAPDSFYYDKYEDIEKVQLTILAATHIKLIQEGRYYAGFTGPWSKIFSKELIMKNNIQFNLKVKGIFDDGLFVLECLQKTKNIYFENIPLYHYRIINTSIVRSYNPKRPKLYENCLKEIKNFINKYEKSEKFLNAYYSRAVMLLGNSIELCYFNKLNKDSYKSKKNEVRKALNNKIYKDAINNVKIEFLTKKQKLYLKFYKTNNIFLLYISVKLIRLLKKSMKK